MFYAKALFYSEAVSNQCEFVYSLDLLFWQAMVCKDC